MRRKIAAGNWKMNGTLMSLNELMLIAGHEAEAAEVVICPPATLISRAVTACQNTKLAIGGQDCHAKETGAHTGDIAAEMLQDLGASHVVVGHSERRADHKESDAEVRAKAEAAYRAGLVAIICVGETLAEREAGRAEEVVGAQLKGSIPASANGENTVIAYEPVWAIGTGKVPSYADIAAMHGFIRKAIPDAENMRVLYGGSVKPSNAKEIFAIDNVDGGLVGGASLKAEDFLPIIAAADSLSKGD